MNALAFTLLILHVGTAIVFIGGLTVAASVFPRFVTIEAAAPYADTGAHPAAIALHRITRFYGRLAIVPPLLGLALAMLLGRLDELWILLAIALVIIGGVVLTRAVIPQQERLLQNPHPQGRRRAGAMAGMVNLIWFTVLILMITKPGSGG